MRSSGNWRSQGALTALWLAALWLALAGLPLVLACLPASAQESRVEAPSAESSSPTPPPRREIEFIRELGAYYTSVAVQIPLADEPVTEGSDMSEGEVYRRLFAASARPSALLLEASIYPMPLLGTHLKKHSPDFYDTRWLGVDVVPAVTAGFQEPWALSAFVGADMRFTRPGEAARDTNRGYMGYLMSVGNRHIRDNVMIDDDWLEFEWKMKGERIFVADRLTWSFRVGGRWHGHPEIRDTVYLGISRSDTNYGLPLLRWLNNTQVTLTTEFSQKDFEFLRQEVIFGKKLPMSRWFSALQFDIGVIHEQRGKYTGQLGAESAGGTTFVFRPGLEF